MTVQGPGGTNQAGGKPPTPPSESRSIGRANFLKSPPPKDDVVEISNKKQGGDEAKPAESNEEAKDRSQGAPKSSGRANFLKS